ncbi:hypothetical protein D7319_32005 [Streptomyces radicis]|uniref:DUF1795 domain-containing protein n=1 Tax=Streptomyces radicis TaxID=1750517 RepID=A0A3A9WBA4_9ACTN|nr:hypothetical protein D7319_32005 [Streptomyces radicis]RKN13111.1 hypothetical protein D7318_31820 [Streptomyces radicis]
MTTGLPEYVPYCVEETLPDGDATRHRAFRTDLDAGAVQITVVRPDASSAAELATLLDAAIEGCATAYEEEYPSSTAEYRDYGTLAVEDGARVHGLHIAQDYGAMDIDLFAVGRDGDTVTFVQWGRLGDFTNAPVADFQDTATTAVDRLR